MKAISLLPDDQQAKRLNTLLEERGVVAPAGGPALPEEGSRSLAEKGDGLPMVRLPGPTRLLSAFAKELGEHCGRDFLFRRGHEVLTANAVDGKLDVVSANALQSLIERRVVCFRLVNFKESVMEVSESMGLEVARGVLQSPMFLELLPSVDRVNSCRLPIMRSSRQGDTGGEGRAEMRPGVAPALGTAPATSEAAPSSEAELDRIELLPEGYDAASRTYTFSARGVVYDEGMSLADGVGFLQELLCEFPFSDWPRFEPGTRVPDGPLVSRSQAVVVAGMLTMFAVGLLPERAKRPCFIYTSNSVGSGKTLLAQLAVAPVSGSARTTTLPRREEELHKLLDTKIRAKAGSLVVDNLRGLVASPSLESLVTSSEWEGRVLGASEEFVAPNSMTIFLTGNQLTVNEDMFRRSLFVDLFLEEADVQARKIGREIGDAWLARPENRSRILSALWAIVRAWDGVGRSAELRRPMNPGRLASFEEWARVIGGMVLFAGLGDPLAPAKLDQGGNLEMQDMRALVLALWRSCAPAAKEFEFKEIVEACVSEGFFEWILVDGEELNQKEKSLFGKLLRRYSGRTFSYQVLGDLTEALAAAAQVAAGVDPAGVAVSSPLLLRFGHRGKHRGRRYGLAKV
jgi:hypothetical protein